MRIPISVAERIAIVVASLLLSVGLIALLSGFFAARDPAGVVGANGVAGPGVPYRDLGHAHLLAGQPHPRYDSDPPTSGAHIPEAVTRNNARLTDDQLLTALELGDIVIVHGTPKPPPGLEAMARSVAGPFSPSLATAGQAVILARRPGTAGLIGLAWTRMVRVASLRIQDFASSRRRGSAVARVVRRSPAGLARPRSPARPLPHRHRHPRQHANPPLVIGDSTSQTHVVRPR